MKDEERKGGRGEQDVGGERDSSRAGRPNVWPPCATVGKVGELVALDRHS